METTRSEFYLQGFTVVHYREDGSVLVRVRPREVTERPLNRWWGSNLVMVGLEEAVAFTSPTLLVIGADGLAAHLG